MPLLVGYMSIWTFFGMLVYLGDALLHTAVASNAWLAEHAWTLGGAVLLLAGGYQFTRLKYRCLEQCRSPFSFILATEKNLPWGRRISSPLGVLLVAWGLALLLGVMPGSQAGLG